MPLEQVPYLLQPVVHPLCQSGNHDMCKKYEDWNYKAEFPCACPDCDHPSPPITDAMREAARSANSTEKSTKKSSRGLDYAAMLEVSSTHDEPPPDADPVNEGRSQEKKEPEVATKSKSTKSTKDTKDTKNTRERGALEESVMAITDEFEEGKIDLPEGKTLTPHTIANLIKEKEGLEKAPSTGAVNAVLQRWDQNYGFALTHEKPYAFKRYSAKGKKQGLEALKQAHRDKLKAERAAKKEDAA